MLYTQIEDKVISVLNAKISPCIATIAVLVSQLVVISYTLRGLY